VVSTSNPTAAFGLDVNPKKTKYVLMSRYQKAGQKHSVKITNRSFEDVTKFQYLVTTLTDQKCMHKEIWERLNSGSACYYSVQSLLSYRLLSRNVMVKMYKNLNSANNFKQHVLEQY
jgi:hypothetical protein